MARKKQAVSLSTSNGYIQETPLFFDYKKIKDTYSVEEQYKLGMIKEEEYKKKLSPAKNDETDKGEKAMEPNTTEKKPKKNKSEYSEQEYIDLILNFMQMVFKGTIKGFEVKNASNGKLKIIIK